MRLFIFGAGATIGTLGLPGVKGFGARLHAVVRDWRSRFGALASVVDALEPEHRRSAHDWDLDAAWTHIDYVAKLYRALGTSCFPGAASAQLHAAVTAVFGRIPRARLIKAYEGKRSFELRHELERVQENDVVVSFNWDVLVEFLLSRRLKSDGLRLVQAPYPHVGGSVRFAKPHASFTWNRHDLSTIDDGQGGPKLDPVPTPAQIIRSEKESDRKRKIEPLLLGAVPIKSELITEVSSRQHAVVMAQWAELLNGLTHADEVCVMGYSFPPEDAYARFLMRQAVRRRRTCIAKVEVYELDGKKFEEVQESIMKVLDVTKNVVQRIGQASSAFKERGVARPASRAPRRRGRVRRSRRRRP